MGVAGSNPAPSKRGEIVGWSAGAVRRHTRALYSVEVSELTGHGWAVTLTLRDLPTSEEWFAIRVAWSRRVERMPGWLRLHWVVEWQERGAPHMHCAVYFDREDARDGVAVVLAWLAVAEPFGAKWGAQHLDAISGAAGWLAYLSKHAARGVAHYQRAGKPPGWEKTGRLYGFRGTWPRHEPEESQLTQAGYWRLRRLARSWRVADARAALLSLRPDALPDRRRAALRRLVAARRALACNEPRRSAVRGVSEWVPEAQGLAFLALLAAEGAVLPETAAEARTRILGGLPTPADVDDARWTAVEAVMADLGWKELTGAEVPS